MITATLCLATLSLIEVLKIAKRLSDTENSGRVVFHQPLDRGDLWLDNDGEKLYSEADDDVHILLY